MKKWIAALLAMAMLLSMSMTLVLAEQDDRPTITVSVYDRGNVPTSVGTITDNPVVDWINEHSPVKVQFVGVPRWNSAETFAAWFAAGTAPDLICEYECATWIREGYTMPLDDLIDEYSVEYKALLEKYPSAKKIAIPSGKDQMHTFVRIWPATNYCTVLIRADWMDKLGLEIPKTVEEFKDVVLALATEDPDGNGEDDTYGISLSDFAYIKNMMGIADQYGLHLDENGDLCFCTERIEAYYELAKWLYDNNIVDHDYLTDTNGEKADADFVSGRMAMLGTSDVKAENLIRELYKNDPEARVTTMPMPATEYGSFNGHVQGGIYNTGFINRNCTHPEDVIKYIDFMQSDEFYARVMFGVEGVHYHFNEKGVPVRTAEEQEKYSAEMQWASGFDYCMTYAKIKMPAAWADPVAKLTEESDRAAVDYAHIINDATKWMFEDGRECTLVINSTVELPTDVQFAYDSMRAEFDGIWDKAVTSGDEYTIEDALADYEKLYEESGYQKYVDFMTDWFSNNRDRIYVRNDNLELKPNYLD